MTDVPTSNRPASFDDLDDRDGRRPLFTVHDLQKLVDVPGALAAVDALVDSIRRWDHNGYRYDAGTPGQISASAAPTRDEQARDLAAAQARYDRGRELYAHYVETGELPKHAYLWRDYLAAEQLAEPADDADHI